MADMSNRFDNLLDAEGRAFQLTLETGKEHIAYKSSYVIDPYVVTMLPQVGDPVSKAFNGDSYPCGSIAKISKTKAKITTTTGDTFSRVGPNSWKIGGKHGTFSLVSGHHDERNPHF